MNGDFFCLFKSSYFTFHSEAILLGCTHINSFCWVYFILFSRVVKEDVNGHNNELWIGSYFVFRLCDFEALSMGVLQTTAHLSLIRSDNMLRGYFYRNAFTFLVLSLTSTCKQKSKRMWNNGLWFTANMDTSIHESFHCFQFELEF